jgi:hypothetical protein
VATQSESKATIANQYPLSDWQSNAAEFASVPGVCAMIPICTPQAHAGHCHMFTAGLRS